MKRNTLARLTLVLILPYMWVVLFLMGGAEVFGKKSPEPQILLEKADACSEILYGSAKKMKYRHEWIKCIKLYRDVYSRYPKSDEAAWALFKAARMHAKLYGYSGQNKDLDDAITIFKSLTKEHPKHRLADDAQYRIGEIFFRNKKDPSQAYVEFLKVDIAYPNGDMRLRARVMMDKLTLILSKKDDQMRKGQSVSSARPLTRVNDIRHWSTPIYTRVVIDLERPVSYSTNLLKADPKTKKPRRLYVDLEKTYVSSDIETSIPIKDGLLQRARAGQHTKDAVRVVLDIQSIEGQQVFHLNDPFRIVVDVRGTEKADDAPRRSVKTEQRPVGKGTKKAEKPDEKLSLARQLGLNVRRIVIDPGHGGRDPGTYHTGGVKEKNIVLNLAKVLSRKVEERLGCEAFLTRDRDVFMRLENRTAFANIKKADLFISLHINAHKLERVHGLETYILNMATDERAVTVAARENATSEKSISDLQKILNDLMLNTKINESSRLAHEVQKGIMGSVRTKYNPVKNLGVKQAPFYVLIGAEMPAILIEIGFITNPTERRRLLGKTYLDTLANGIVDGINEYIRSINQIYMGG